MDERFERVRVAFPGYRVRYYFDINKLAELWKVEKGDWEWSVGSYQEESIESVIEQLRAALPESGTQQQQTTGGTNGREV